MIRRISCRDCPLITFLDDEGNAWCEPRGRIYADQDMCKAGMEIHDLTLAMEDMVFEPDHTKRENIMVKALEIQEEL